MQKHKKFILILIIIIFLSGIYLLMVSFISRTNDKEISSLTEISESDMVKPTLNPTEKPMVEPTETPTVQPSVTHTAESTATPTIVTDESNVLKSWTGDYVYDEYCPPDENLIYSLSIYEEDENYYADITIYGFQTNQLISAKVTGDENSINFLFDKYLPDNLYEPYKKGDILLSFKKKNSDLITIWKEIQPMVLNTPNERICFEIQNNDNGSFVNADEQQAYTDDELQDMALQYYTMINGYAPSYVDVDTVLDDNMVMIHLYDINELDGVGFTFTYDWYTVNRYTAKGYDFNENEIDLTDVSGD